MAALLALAPTSSRAPTSLAFLALVGCASIQPGPTPPPTSPPPTPPAQAPAEAARARLEVHGQLARLELGPDGPGTTVPLTGALLGDVLLPAALPDDLPVDVRLGDGVASSLRAGHHRCSDVRHAIFVPFHSRRDILAGEHTLSVVAADDEIALDSLAQTLGSLTLPAGRTLIVVGAPPRRGPGFIAIPEDTPSHRLTLLTALLSPQEGPRWLRRVVGRYLAERHELRRHGNGAQWLATTYRAHRTHLGVAIAEGDLEGGLLVAFCLEIDGHPPRLPLADEVRRRLRAWGPFRGVLDLDACLRQLDARLVARVVPRYDTTSIQQLFDGAVLQGEPLTVQQGSGPFRAGDVLTQLGPQRIEHPTDLAEALQSVEPGQRLLAHVRRGDVERRIWLTAPELVPAGQEVRFLVLPTPMTHPRWPFTAHSFDTPRPPPPN